jgi:hypothetical protein
MEASSLRLDHGAAGGRQPSNSSGPQTVPEFNHETRYTAPRAQPVDIVIPLAAPSPQEDHVLKVVQQPEIAKVAAPKEKGRSIYPSLTLSPFTEYPLIYSSDAT